MSNNLYIDTRGLQNKSASFTEALIQGLAEGGGLFVPSSIPHFDISEIIAFADMPYASRAARVYEAFDIDLPPKQIESLMEQAYSTNFKSPEICPITSLDAQTHILELWHGPTSAFKDMALQCLPLFFSASAEKLRHEGKIDHDFLILVATSGDTGTAALAGFKDRDRVKIGVLYPQDGVSDIQYRQMATADGNNVSVWALDGNFDDCQTGVKAVFNDKIFEEELLRESGLALSSANSINWGRLLPQIVYYVSSYSVLVQEGKLVAGDLLDVCVPTGNFGNILAAWYAKQMGTPIDKLICASNENRVLTDFINTGTYDIRDRDFVLTPSPSMDILISSNLERLLFELTDRNDEAVRNWMEDLRSTKRFKIDSKTFSALREHFISDSVDNAECLRTIQEVYDTHHYLIDPHTAVAYRVTERLRGENPVLVASTAHWAKFGESVYRGLTGLDPEEELPARIKSLSGTELNEFIAQEFDCHAIPYNLSGLDMFKVRFTDTIDKKVESIEEAVRRFVQ